MQKNRNKHILIARFSALGDVAMTLPVVYDACAASPDTEFLFLTRSHPSQIFVNKPENLSVLGINTDNFKGIAGMWRLAKALKSRYEVDEFIDLHDVMRTKLLRIFLRAFGVRSYTIVKDRAAKRALTRKHHKVLVQLKPTPERYRDVFYKAGIPLANDFKSLYGSGKGDPTLFAAITPPKRQGEKWLAVAPFARHQGKIYPMELLQQVVDHYAYLPEWKIFILGYGLQETAQIDALSKGRTNVVNMAAKNLGIAAEMSLMSHCDVLLSMDSANMHLASLVGLRAVTVWGATHPYAGFLGWNQKTADVVQLDMVCRPCSVFGNKPCHRSDYHCLRGIPPAMIISKIDG